VSGTGCEAHGEALQAPLFAFQDPPIPRLDLERAAWAQGERRVAGVDEVGRGALAGPVVAAAVVFRAGDDVEALAPSLRDSKQLAPAARLALYPRIVAAAWDWALGEASAAEVDALGISRASALAMRRALTGLRRSPDRVLVDGYPLRGWRGPQAALIRGDARVTSIAAASIVAKVRRDAAMVALGQRCGAYGFDAHKGYGTAAHLEALGLHGPSVHHRLTWSPCRPALGP
jgi:ribonuclease HII